MSAANSSTGRLDAAYRERFPGSAKLFERSSRLFPNGVTHDGRYLQPFPIFVAEALGSKKTDVDGHELIDYWMGHGALLLGHSHPAIVAAVQRQVAKSTHPGACHELEIEWAEWVRRLVPSVEVMRFTNSGTEATLMAIRICRIVSGRTKVIKFAGHFHGWHDAVIISSEPPHPANVLAGELPETEDYPTPGVTDGVSGDIVIVPPNDLAALARAIDEHQPACVIHEGNGARWGAVPARPDFVRGIRELTLADLRAAEARGERVMLLGLAEPAGADWKLSVGPVSLPVEHPLTRMSGEEMGVVYHTDIAGRLFASSSETDATPTAAAMLRDLIGIAASR